MSDREYILGGLRPMFEEARKTGKWFHCSYQDLWFSPDHLQKEHDNGKFVWDAVNWTLRDPQEMINEAERRVQNAKTELDRVTERVFGKKK